ncbi:DNA topoisomerase IV, alpha subunit [Eremomyces bilateralis CBS 781.70]|uniref:DNA topoisomerase (ATP-hydrolyzing) n=1 Tax=Eremomyces bilateralis CBS 781.70 TaxID=1392243 RepID=A0A6G1G7I4_9PEZI|nr:DNA topoisomerase IV, alpha subunit [Eremomyces bilateralis CBS 781.70]KAF1813891.1 DNA topoisomerase IV, alpha subunit [Eremomyces bilateralis CBS 781.70]
MNMEDEMLLVSSPSPGYHVPDHLLESTSCAIDEDDMLLFSKSADPLVKGSFAEPDLDGLDGEPNQSESSRMDLDPIIQPLDLRDEALLHVSNDDAQGEPLRMDLEPVIHSSDLPDDAVPHVSNADAQDESPISDDNSDSVWSSQNTSSFAFSQDNVYHGSICSDEEALLFDSPSSFFLHSKSPASENNAHSYEASENHPEIQNLLRAMNQSLKLSLGVTGGSVEQSLSVSDAASPVETGTASTFLQLQDGTHDHDAVAERIRSVLSGVALQNSRSESPSIFLKSRKEPQQGDTNNADPPSGLANQLSYRTICLRTSSLPRTERFVTLVLVLSQILMCIQGNIVLSKRDIYYRHPDIFRTQSTVDRIIDDVSFSLDVPRHLLHITAAAKGLALGACRLESGFGSSSKFSNKEGTLLHRVKDNEGLYCPDVKWIIVVEKEASFRSLAESWLGSIAIQEGLIITAKGYPDIATRSFLRKVVDVKSQCGDGTVPTYALVDFDPDGISIYLTYKYGSRALSHLNSELNVASLRWMGPTGSDVVASGAEHGDDLLSLTERDRRRVRCLLGRKELDQDNTEQDLRRELQVMLLLNVKAEIQCLDRGHKGVANWVSERMKQR